MFSADSAPMVAATTHRRRSVREVEVRASLRTVVLTLALLVGTSRRVSAQLAVVVHPANAVSELSMDRLRRLFLGQATTFSSGGHARLVTHAGSAAEFNRTALGLSSEIVRSRWMAIAFRGEATTLPAEFASVDDVMRFVREHRDAVAFVPLASVDGNVKVLRIDGRRPTDAVYLTR